MVAVLALAPWAGSICCCLAQGAKVSSDIVNVANNFYDDIVTVKRYHYFENVHSSCPYLGSLGCGLKTKAGSICCLLAQGTKVSTDIVNADNIFHEHIVTV